MDQTFDRKVLESLRKIKSNQIIYSNSKKIHYINEELTNKIIKTFLKHNKIQISKKVDTKIVNVLEAQTLDFEKISALGLAVEKGNSYKFFIKETNGKIPIETLLHEYGHIVFWDTLGGKKYISKLTSFPLLLDEFKALQFEKNYNDSIQKISWDRYVLSPAFTYRVSEIMQSINNLDELLANDELMGWMDKEKYGLATFMLKDTDSNILLN